MDALTVSGATFMIATDGASETAPFGPKSIICLNCSRHKPISNQLNMEIRKLIVVTLGLFLGAMAGTAQHGETDHTSGEHASEHSDEYAKHHVIQGVVSHTHIFSADKDTEGRRFLTLASFGLNYNYNFHEKWGIGLHSDIILEDFTVEHQGSEVIERETPVAFALMGTYRIGKPWSFLLGPGVEVDSENAFYLIRAGVEPAWHFGKGWEVSLILTYDFKFDAYDAFTLGIGMAKLFGGNPHH